MAKDSDWLGNPALRDYDGPPVETTFTVRGAAVKTLILLAVLTAAFGWSWHYSTRGYSEAWTAATAAVEPAEQPPKSIAISQDAKHLIIGGALGGLALALGVIFFPKTAPYLSPLYAGAEGVALGAISAAFEAKYPGVVFEAVTSTLGVFFGMLVLFGSGLVRPTARFTACLTVAVWGIVVLYTTDLIMLQFGTYVPVLHGGGFWGTVLQLAIVGVASFCLITDFGLISEAAKDKAPKWFEWYAGFSLLVTLVWLYLEILKLWASLKKD